MGQAQTVEALPATDPHSRDLWAEFDKLSGGNDRSAKQIFTIRDLSREFGVTARTLRF